MKCKHEFNYFGDQKGSNASARYFKCIKCGAVKVRDDDGGEYLIPSAKSDSSK